MTKPATQQSESRKSQATGRRVLIVVFDALRPDMVSAELMPRLSEFAGEGIRFTSSRSVFPTETRVNQTSLVTGVRPGRHGIVGNKFIEPKASPDALFNTGDEDILRKGDQNLSGELLGVPSLGERLAKTGLTLATLSSGTPGGGRILHHRAETLGGFRLAMHRPDYCLPSDSYDTIVDRIGKIPAYTIPSLDWLTWSVDAWLSYVEPDVTPDVGILWMCEPDSSYHYQGIGSPHNLGAIRHADAQFGRLLDGLDLTNTDVITVSDHGQLAVQGEAIDLVSIIESAGLSVGEVPSASADVAISLDSAGGVFVRDNDPQLIRQVVDTLSAHPCCGALSVDASRAQALGCFTHEDFGIDGPRAPDVGVVLASNDEMGPHGWPGATVHDAPYPDGGGIHGGLHPIELNNWLAVRGDSFAQRSVSHVPTGIIDVLPTVMQVLGLQAPDDIDGRVIHEALADKDAVRSIPVEIERIQAPSGQVLQVSRVGTTRYLDGIV